MEGKRVPYRLCVYASGTNCPTAMRTAEGVPSGFAYIADQTESWRMVGMDVRFALVTQGHGRHLEPRNTDPEAVAGDAQPPQTRSMWVRSGVETGKYRWRICPISAARQVRSTGQR